MMRTEAACCGLKIMGGDKNTENLSKEFVYKREGETQDGQLRQCTSREMTFKKLGCKGLLKSEKMLRNREGIGMEQGPGIDERWKCRSPG